MNSFTERVRSLVLWPCSTGAIDNTCQLLPLCKVARAVVFEIVSVHASLKCSNYYMFRNFLTCAQWNYVAVIEIFSCEGISLKRSFTVVLYFLFLFFFTGFTSLFCRL